MKYLNISIALLLVLASLLTGGCSGSKNTAADDNAVDEPEVIAPETLDVTVDAIFDSANTGLTCSCNEQSLIINFTQIPAEGQFVRITLPAAYSIGDLNWSNVDETTTDATVLCLAIPATGSLDAGVVPLAGYQGGLVTLVATLGQTGQTSSTQLSGTEHAVLDLQVMPASNDQVKLTWTQVLAGDYNFDAVVDLSDLREVAEHYGATVDRSSPMAAETAAYWIDGTGDGVVDSDDSNTILQHINAQLTGYNIRCDGVLLTPTVEDEPTISVSSAAARDELPPQYSVELDGTTSSTWSVTAVDGNGEEGASGSASPVDADLLVNVTINGVDLADLAGLDPGEADVIKEGTRVVLPVEDVGRPTLASPALVSGSSAVYTALPAGTSLLLDVRYLPSFTAQATSAVHSSSDTGGLPDVESPEQLQVTAIPFSIEEDAGLLTITADITFSPNPGGGYFITLVSTVSPSNQTATVTTTRLSSADSILVCDADSNGSFSDEMQFLDADLDQVSNQRLALEQNMRDYTPDGMESIAVQANLVDIALDEGCIIVDSINPIFDEAPPSGARLQLFEQTEFAGDLDPNFWQPGNRLSLILVRMRDPQGAMPDVFWVERAELVAVADDGTNTGELEASDDQADRVDITWTTVTGYDSYRLERWPEGGNPLFHGPMPDWSVELPNTGPHSYTDICVIPGARYHYKYYGHNAGNDVLLGEDSGGTTGADQPQPPMGMHLHGTISALTETELQVLTETEGMQVLNWDDDTQWLDWRGSPRNAGDCHPGDEVLIMSADAGDVLYAEQVVLLEQNGPPL